MEQLQNRLETKLIQGGTSVILLEKWFWLFVPQFHQAYLAIQRLLIAMVVWKGKGWFWWLGNGRCQRTRNKSTNFGLLSLKETPQLTSFPHQSRWFSSISCTTWLQFSQKYYLNHPPPLVKSKPKQHSGLHFLHVLTPNTTAPPCRTARSTAKPGSEIKGVPASETKATDLGIQLQQILCNP